MSKIDVELHSTLKEKINKGKITIDAENITDALEKLKKKFGKKLQKELYEKGKIKDYYVILLNGSVMDVNRLSQTKLSSGDILSIFPFIAGG